MIAILSPHLDDAVLSCWSVMTGPEPVRVLNVFTGAPPEGSGVGWWDRMTEAEDSAERMRERIEEDRAALALAGREAVNLGLLEAQYREDAADPAVTAAIAAVLPPRCELYAPAAIGDHADHALVRDAALELRRGGRAVTLYADLPHAIRLGWPSWVANGRGAPEVDLHWDLALHPAGFERAAPLARVLTLESETQARKIAAVIAYETQLEALSALAFRPLPQPHTLRYEVFWPLA